MSLKVVHILFIILCVALTLAFGVWAFTTGIAAPDAFRNRVWGVISFACCAGLLVYGVCFFKKLSQLKGAS